MDDPLRRMSPRSHTTLSVASEEELLLAQCLSLSLPACPRCVWSGVPEQLSCAAHVGFERHVHPPKIPAQASSSSSPS